MSFSSEKPLPTKVKPRIIIHGGCGNITRSNLPASQWASYRSALLSILRSSSAALSKPGATALEIATATVTQLENNPLFNAGRGAVFTRNGTIELEASVMVSSGYRKRGVGVMGVTRVRNPILLAKEMLVRGEEEDGNGGGAQGHCQLTGDVCEGLAGKWGLERVERGYFWTRRRWEEHRKGLGLSCGREEYGREKKSAAASHGGFEYENVNGEEDDLYLTNDPSWNGTDYLPQGTVGCVVLDSTGTICVATSTGGITNKLPGRVGDTPTLGAGFWAEEWQSPTTTIPQQISPSPLSILSEWTSALTACIPSLTGSNTSTYLPLPQQQQLSSHRRRAAGISGTGNGDSFLRLSAVRTACAIARFSQPETSLQKAVTAVAGPNGMLQLSAEDRWRKTGEGEGGMIGIEIGGDGVGRVVADFNCGGMFRAWVDGEGVERVMVFRGEF
jgi:L-asparaginase